MSTYHRALKQLSEEVIPVPGSQPIPDSLALRKEVGKERSGGKPEGGSEGNPALTFHFTPADVNELRVLLQDNPDNRLSPQFRNFIFSS